MAGNAIPKQTIGMCTASESACIRRASSASGAGCFPSAPVTCSAATARRPVSAMAREGTRPRRRLHRFGWLVAAGRLTAVADRLRALPSVDRLATAVARAELADRRAALLAGADDDADLVDGARARLRPSLRRVLNATGVIVHTNLGRAPLASAARQAVAAAATGYANLELDLASGERA